MIFGMDFHQTKMKLLLNRKGAQVRYLPDLMIVQAVQTIQKPVEVITAENSGVPQKTFSPESSDSIRLIDPFNPMLDIIVPCLKGFSLNI